MQSALLPHSPLVLQPRPQQIRRTQRTLPVTVSTQRHPLLFLHRRSQPWRLPHSAASASLVGPKASNPPPKIAVPTNFSALRREIVPLASPFARASKEYSSVLSSRVVPTLNSLSFADTESPPFRPACPRLQNRSPRKTLPSWLCCCLPPLTVTRTVGGILTLHARILRL